MSEFYRRVWLLGEPKSRALWNAKRMLRDATDKQGEPAYSLRDWAGWILSGDPD